MQAFVLAGGLGTRLRPYTHAIPKPLMPLGDRSILDILLHGLSASGVRKVTLSLGYLSTIIAAFVRDGSSWSIEIEIVEEQKPLGTAAPLLLATSLEDDFLVINGDTLTDLDFSLLLGLHREKAALATIFAPTVEDQVDYGVLVTDAETGQLRDYIEKPKRRIEVSSGVYAFSRRALAYIPRGERFDMPDLIRAALADRADIQIYRSDAYWRDIGRPDHYEAAIEDYIGDPDRFLKRKRR
jgi:NDP-sugar pyrophosphorylase family protein